MCVNGKAFVGPLATAVAAGIVIAKIADAALCTCNKCKTLEDDFCAGFCKELLISQDLVESAAAKQNRAKTDQWQNEFGWITRDDGISTLSPKASNTTSTAALEGKASAEKRTLTT